MKIGVFIGSICLSILSIQAQEVSKITVAKGEKWYGASTALGRRMPFTTTLPKQYLSQSNYNTQCVSFLVSNQGRYIYSDTPFDIEFKNSTIIVDNCSTKVQVIDAGKTLREAFLAARNSHFHGSGQIPDKQFFTTTQYTTWIELDRNQNQADIEQYVSDIVVNGFDPGVIVIEDGWQRYYGNLDFKTEQFPDPSGMINSLHAKGFKVMVWISPFVTADSPDFLELEENGYLITEKGSDIGAMVSWWNGNSAIYDFTNPDAVDYFVAKLKTAQEKYGIDGFKFEAGDVGYYQPSTQDYFDSVATANDQTHAWASIGAQFGLNHYRACWNMQGEALVQRLNDKPSSWVSLNAIIPEILNAGLMGYAYTMGDIIGGGKPSTFDGIRAVDQTLIVRSAQIHALMPIMQFSVAPWRVLDREHLEYCVHAAALHKEVAPYIIQLAQNAALQGDPIVRSMEYVFPHKGYADCNDQFMLGDKYLVAPILTPDGKRIVRLPAGTWVDDLGQRFRGPIVMNIEAELGRLPYYTKN